ncbi:hypothetical protein [Catelliglobosispora koreensis]|uniref:hypothetical protein n=1 Tax=Catelliglobosispora koreensis TaxID=129052 RepID=UPI0003758C09|nr:hypothetical protein [Catelliglobosispora koreensis]
MTVSYDGRVFVPTKVSPPVTPTPDTPRGVFRQQGDLVSVEFSGGWLRSGWLVGVCRPDGCVDGVYCLAFGNGDLVAGSCVYVPTVLDDGRLRIAEQWRRIDGSTGVSTIEEVRELNHG